MDTSCWNTFTTEGKSKPLSARSHAGGLRTWKAAAGKADSGLGAGRRGGEGGLSLRA